jgi:hypothetical protein
MTGNRNSVVQPGASLAADGISFVLHSAPDSLASDADRVDFNTFD